MLLKSCLKAAWRLLGRCLKSAARPWLRRTWPPRRGGRGVGGRASGCFLGVFRPHFAAPVSRPEAISALARNALRGGALGSRLLPLSGGAHRWRADAGSARSASFASWRHLRALQARAAKIIQC
eukprot:9174025-Alexandrium_andersonii.AAC.1